MKRALQTALALAGLLLLVGASGPCSEAEQDVNSSVKEQSGVDLTSPTAGVGAGTVGDKDAANALGATSGSDAEDHRQMGDYAASQGDWRTAADEYRKALDAMPGGFGGTGQDDANRRKIGEKLADALESAALDDDHAYHDGTNRSRSIADIRNEYLDAAHHYVFALDDTNASANPGPEQYRRFHAGVDFYYAGNFDAACVQAKRGLALGSHDDLRWLQSKLADRNVTC